MEEETIVTPDASEQDVDTGVDNETNDSLTNDSSTDDSTGVDDERYLSQKKRAEKAEAEAKALREQLAQKKVNPKTEKKEIINHDRDESYLISVFGSKGLGYDEITEYLEKARKIAKLEEIPLAKALETDYFKAFDTSYQAEKKQKLASLGASKGSGGSVSKKSFQTPGLSDEEFTKMLKDKTFNR
jgi:hypothetical protein